MVRKHEGGSPPDMGMGVSLEGYWSERHVERYGKAMEHWGFMEGMRPLEFWAWLFEPPGKLEGKQQKATGVAWAYADRLAILATKYLSLGGRERDYILRARRHEPPIWWRGDEIDMFQRIVQESLRYFRLDESEKAQYRGQIMAIAKGIANANRGRAA